MVWGGNGHICKVGLVFLKYGNDNKRLGSLYSTGTMFDGNVVVITGKVRVWKSGLQNYPFTVPYSTQEFEKTGDLFVTLRASTAALCWGSCSRDGAVSQPLVSLTSKLFEFSWCCYAGLIALLPQNNVFPCLKHYDWVLNVHLQSCFIIRLIWSALANCEN